MDEVGKIVGPIDKFPMGRYVPGQTFVHKLDPRFKIIFAMIFAAAIFSSNTTLLLGIHTVAALFVIRLTRISFFYFLQSLLGMSALIVFIGIYHMLTDRQGLPVWSLGRLIIYDQGLLEAIIINVRLILLICLTSLLTLTTSPGDLTAGLERLLRPFTVIRFPAGEFALMLAIALRYIPIAAEEIDIMIKARKARGAFYEGRNWIRRMQEPLRLIVPLLVQSFRRAEQLSVAMESRCYKGERGRTHRHTLRMGWREALAGTAACFFFASTFIIRFF